MSARRWRESRRKQARPGGGLLTLMVALLAVAACALVSPPSVREVAAVFAPGKQAAGPTAVVLPAREWFLVESGGQAVAACGALIEAEIVRSSKDALTSIRRVETDEVSLRVTAAPAQLSALKESADALMETFRTFEQMAYLETQDALRVAQASYTRLALLSASASEALSGSENPVVRGLTGLVGSCQEAMTGLLLDASPERVQRSHALLVQQYEAYVAYLMSK